MELSELLDNPGFLNQCTDFVKAETHNGKKDKELKKIFISYLYSFGFNSYYAEQTYWLIKKFDLTELSKKDREEKINYLCKEEMYGAFLNNLLKKVKPHLAS